MYVCMYICMYEDSQSTHLYRTFARMSQSDLRLTKIIVFGMPIGLPSGALFSLFRRDTRVLSFSWLSMHMMCCVMA